MKSSARAGIWPTIAMIGVVIIAIGGTFSWKRSVWAECRADDHSFGYCLSLVTR